jgi:hypothetical protein
MDQQPQNQPVPMKRKLNWKKWGLIVGAVVLVGLAGWLGYQNKQLGDDLSMKDGEIHDLNSKVALLSATPTPTPTPTATPTPSNTGTISGAIAYPASTAPPQTICAVKTTDAKSVTCIKHDGSASGSLNYSLSVAPGTYYVYASLQQPQGDFTTDYKAYYNKYVACQQAGNCAAGLHNQYVAVTVATGKTVTGVNPTDWYAKGLGQ